MRRQGSLARFHYYGDLVVAAAGQQIRMQLAQYWWKIRASRFHSNVIAALSVFVGYPAEEVCFRKSRR
jgi:hypothetical protein